MKKIATLLFGMGALLSGNQLLHAQEVLPANMSAISNSSLTLTVKDNVNRSTNNKPIVKLPDGSLIFTATSSTTGEELYICKNDQVSIVKDIVAGTDGSNPQWLTVVGDKVYFTATTADQGQELWITDGTEAGTKLVKDIYEGATGSNLFGLTSFNGKCLFFARDLDSELDPIIDSQNAEEWLWASDGTADGTTRIADVPTRKGIDGMSGYIVPSGDKAFFIGYHRDYNETLWVTDGTSAGTSVLKDVYPLAATSGSFKTQAATIDWLTNVKNNANNVRVVFRANTLNDSGTKIGSEIWCSDGTAEGTKWVGVDYNPGETDGVANNTEFAFPVEYNGKVYFRAKDGVHGCEPGVTDFTAAGTHYVCDINYWSNDPKYDSWGPEYPYIWNGYMFCQANGSYYYPAGTYQDSGYCLWRYNMSEGGVTPTTANGLTGFQYQSNWTNGVEIYPGNNSDEARYFTPCGGRLYFRAQDTGSNHELWVLDGVSATPRKVSDMEGDSKPHSFTVVGDALYFVTSTTNILYKYNPEALTGIETAEATNSSLSVYPNPAVANVDVNSAAQLTSITVVDLTGNTVISQEGSNKSIQVSSLPSGVYIVYAKTVNGELLTTKLIKK